MDYETTDITKTVKKHMQTTQSKARYCLFILVILYGNSFLFTNPKNLKTPPMSIKNYIVCFCFVFGIIAVVKYSNKNSKTVDVPSSCIRGVPCDISVTFDKDMSSPVYIYFFYDQWWTSYLIY